MGKSEVTGQQKLNVSLTLVGDDAMIALEAGGSPNSICER